MPWGRAHWLGPGPINPFALRTLRAGSGVPLLVVDAGIGAPSPAAAAMELGFDAVLLNSAVSQPWTRCAWPRIGLAIEAGRAL